MDTENIIHINIFGQILKQINQILIRITSKVDMKLILIISLSTCISMDAVRSRGSLGDFWSLIFSLGLLKA